MSTLGIGTNELAKDTGACTNLYSGQVEEAFGLILTPLLPTLVNLFVVINPLLRINLLSNCDTRDSSFDYETYSNCDTKQRVDDEINSNCDTCLFEDESIRLDGVKFLYHLILLSMTIHVSHFVLRMIVVIHF